MKLFNPQELQQAIIASQFFQSCGCNACKDELHRLARVFTREDDCCGKPRRSRSSEVKPAFEVGDLVRHKSKGAIGYISVARGDGCDVEFFGEPGVTWYDRLAVNDFLDPLGKKVVEG